MVPSCSASNNTSCNRKRKTPAEKGDALWQHLKESDGAALLSKQLLGQIKEAII